MRSLIYSASLVLIAVTTYLLLSFDYIRDNTNKVNLEEIFFEAPDSTSIFSTIQIGIHLPSRIKSGFALVHIDDNRLWNSKDSVFFISNSNGPIFVNCSFADTGKKNIECYIILPDICTKVKQCVNVKLALKPSLQRKNANSFIMITPAVKDTVNYVWEFENGLIVYANKSDIILPSMGKGNYSGKLYVVCRNYKSPEVKFDFSDDLLNFKKYQYQE